MLKYRERHRGFVQRYPNTFLICISKYANFSPHEVRAIAGYSRLNIISTIITDNNYKAP